MFFLFIIKYCIAFVLYFNVKAHGNPVYLDLSKQLDKSINVMYLKVIIFNRILTKTNQGRNQITTNYWNVAKMLFPVESYFWQQQSK